MNKILKDITNRWKVVHGYRCHYVPGTVKHFYGNILYLTLFEKKKLYIDKKGRRKLIKK